MMTTENNGGGLEEGRGRRFQHAKRPRNLHRARPARAKADAALGARD